MITLRKVHLLATLNISNPSNFEADSGFVFLQTVLKSILSTESSWKVTLLCPPGTPEIHPNVKLIPCLCSNNKYQTRYDFPWVQLAEILKYEAKDYDLLYINQPELTANLLSLLQTLRGCSLPTIVYMHYIAISKPDTNIIHYDPSLNDWMLGQSILLRQCEPLLLADKVIIGSIFGQNLLKDIIKKLLNLETKAAFEVIPPPTDHPLGFEADCSRPSGLPVILYNHRLYGHYGTHEILNWLIAFNNKNPNKFRLVVTDPTNGRTAERNQLDPSVDSIRKAINKITFAKIQHAKSRAEYHGVLTSATVGLAPLREAPLWSMSSVDVMATGRPLIAPNIGPFPEMLKGLPDLLYEDQTDFEFKLGRLLFEHSHWLKMAEYCFQRSLEYTHNRIAERFKNLFSRLTQ